MELGDAMKENFLLDKSVTFINHGSYGPVPKSIMEQRIKYLYEQESQPDLWFRFKLPTLYEQCIAAVAKFVGGNKEQMALVENVTTGINTIIKSLTFHPGDKILIQTHTYDAVKNIAYEIAERYGAEVITAEIPLSMKSEDELVEVYRKEHEKHKDIKLQIIDHITSCSAILFPVKKLVKLGREFGAMTLIDGAHAPGQVELNLEEIGADFYSANLHKWCFVPRSCGFIWFAKKYSGTIRPLVTSHGYKRHLNDQFNFLGTRDVTNYFCIPHALQFHKDVGGLKALQAHAGEVLDYGCKVIGDALGAKEMDIPKSMKAPYMRLVKLPIDKPAELLAKSDPEMSARTKMNLKMSEFCMKHSVGIAFVFLGGSLWVRFSAASYNGKNDYVRARDALLKELQEMKAKC